MSEKMNDLVEQNKEFLNRELPGMTVDQCKALSNRLGDLIDKQHAFLAELVQDEFKDFSIVDAHSYNSGLLAGLDIAREAFSHIWLSV